MILRLRFHPHSCVCVRAKLSREALVARTKAFSAFYSIQFHCRSCAVRYPKGIVVENGTEQNIVELVTEQRACMAHTQQNVKSHRTSFILHFLFSHSSAIDRTVRLFFYLLCHIYSALFFTPDIYIILPIWHLRCCYSERQSDTHGERDLRH